MRIKNNTLLHAQDARRGRAFSVLLILFSLSQAYATTWIVQPEPGGHFIHVQDAIDGATHGDTILVEPGTYYENINFIGKNVVITSQYLFTEDEYYINHTILDGNHIDRVVTIENGETRAAQLIAFTIQNGKVMQNQSEPVLVYGAGIKINNSSPSIRDCTIKNNKAPFKGGGAGIAVYYNANPYVSGLSIHENHASMGGGGIILFDCESTSIEFDPINLCSVYNNYAGYHSDISIGYSYPLEIVIPLDTFTVSSPDEHFISFPQALVLTIEQGFFEPVNHDLYINPNGDDSNSGASFEEPLKTIQHALTIIKRDSLDPYTIFLDEGVYAPSNGQHFPLNLRSYVNMQGAGKDLTVFDGENQQVQIIASYVNHYKISNLSLSHAPYAGIYRALTVTENINAKYSNIGFYQNTGGVINNLQWASEAFPHPENSNILFDSLEVIDNACFWTITLRAHATTIFQNSIIRNSESVYSEVMEAYLNWPLQILKTFYLDTEPKHISRNVEITQNENLDADYPLTAMALHVADSRVEISNCTFADNSAPVGGAITLEDAEVIIVNSILYDNEPRQIWLYNAYGDTPNTVTIKNCLIQDAEWGINLIGSNTINWLDGNFDVAPWFQGGEENPYYLTANSPAIDAGTDFFVWEGDTIVNMSPDEYSGLAPDIGAYEYHEPDAIDENKLSEGFELYGNFPNPFNNSTQISFSVPTTGDVELKIFNMKGQLIEQQLFEGFSTGIHKINWDAGYLQSGLYLYQIESRKMKVTGKALLVK
ncbi:MAG: DUF1565 domain-containing protein [Candidatus Marinimicrobia bacterium]|nr:DUF1565 domain-containing protein [Candidatus Neomarinimicrobiota bacterium]